jgi:hypothetical protein
MADETMSNQELITQCFYYLNSFKRHRALENIKNHARDRDAAVFHKLKQYEFIDSLELGLRAIQKGQREIETKED